MKYILLVIILFLSVSCMRPEGFVVYEKRGNSWHVKEIVILNKGIDKQSIENDRILIEENTK